MEWYALIPCEGKMDMVLLVNIILDRENLTLADTGESAVLSATITPDYASVKEIIWISSDETVAKVNENGVVTAVNKGQAVITAAAALPCYVAASCKVTVEGKAARRS